MFVQTEDDRQIVTADESYVDRIAAIAQSVNIHVVSDASCDGFVFYALTAKEYADKIRKRDLLYVYL